MKSQIIFPFETPPDEGTVTEVASGILWLRLPLPFALNHVHVWLIRDGDNGWFVVDSGIGGSRMHALWDHIIERHLGGLPITRLLITHYHPDHIGSAGYLYDKFRPQILMTHVEWLTARALALDTASTYAAATAEHYARLGMPDDIIHRQLEGGNRYAKGVDIPPPVFSPLHHGDVLKIGGSEWHILVGGGHSPAQVSLYSPERKVYISADQVLSHITPNVSTWAYDPTYDALGDFMQTLGTTAPIPEASLVLPSHGMPFYGLHDRVRTLIFHHDERIEQIADLCKTPQTVHGIVVALFSRRPLDVTQTTFAMGEILAHCNYMLNNNRLRRYEENGQWLFEAI